MFQKDLTECSNMYTLVCAEISALLFDACERCLVCLSQARAFCLRADTERFCFDLHGVQSGFRATPRLPGIARSTHVPSHVVMSFFVHYIDSRIFALQTRALRRGLHHDVSF